MEGESPACRSVRPTRSETDVQRGQSDFRIQVAVDGQRSSNSAVFRMASGTVGRSTVVYPAEAKNSDAVVVRRYSVSMLSSRAVASSASQSVAPYPCPRFGASTTTDRVVFSEARAGRPASVGRDLERGRPLAQRGRASTAREASESSEREERRHASVVRKTAPRAVFRHPGNQRFPETARHSPRARGGVRKRRHHRPSALLPPN